MRVIGPLIAFMAMVAFFLATYFEVRDDGWTTLAYAFLGLLLLAIPTGIAAIRDLADRDRDGRIG